MAHCGGGESSSSSDTCYSTPNWKYDVFLGFAGKDTRLNFTDHLDGALKRFGIKTFRDDVDLQRGGNVKQDLFQAIEDSLCAVVIISKTYANSRWCLDELQKILESQHSLHRRVFPIFYKVDPADVRNQGKSFGKAFAQHEKKFRKDPIKVQNWKNAVSEIGNISGWDTKNKPEADLIEKIVQAVWAHLIPKLPSYDDNLVGIQSRVADMMQILEIGLDDVRFIGIWGMGGVGKTTLARVVSEKLSDKFEVCCFLDKVKQEGRLVLQRKLLVGKEVRDEYEGMKMIRKFLHNKKVLLVLDDVDDISQLKNLAESPNWFGKGSRIIITTRNSQLLNVAKAGERIYEMKIMKEDESLQLFSIKAFHKDHPEEGYLELSKSVVKYAGCLPLALEVLGNFLYGKSEAEWRDALDRLKEAPEDDVLQVLKISYDGLKNAKEKAIFLDIACFFKGRQKKEVTQILERCGLHPTIGIKILIEKTLLVETEDGKLEMHDLLQELGRNIVEQEFPNDIGKRSRLWLFKDIKEVLENNKGSDTIQAIVYGHHYDEKLEELDQIEVHPEAFSKMSNMRLFVLYQGNVFSRFNLPWGLNCFASALKVVQWPAFPLEALPVERPLNKLVDIQMYYSKIKRLWNDIQFMKDLKSIDLSCSEDLTETPNFSGVPNLEHLRLSDCHSLVKVDPSLGQLKKLVEVYLDNCQSLEILPEKLETNSLTKLDLNECEKVAVLPEFGEGMEKLSYLDASKTAISILPESLGSLRGLGYLYLNGCKILNLDKILKTHITRHIAGLNVMSLTELYLRECGLNDGSIPVDFGSLSSLIVLDLSYNDFVNLPPDCFSGLYRLAFLSLDCCKRLKSLPRLSPRLSRLHASGCDSMEPLSSDRQLWNLVASLDHECRERTKYEIYDDKEYGSYASFKVSECLPFRDFCAVIPGDEMPSWFPEKESYECNEYDLWKQLEIKVDIPPYCRDSEWCGIVVCLLFSGSGLNIRWSSKAAEDDHYLREESDHNIFGEYGNQKRHQCIMVLGLNEETCWRHLTPHHSNSLHIRLYTYVRGGEMEKEGCRWRVITKEEIQEQCRLNHFNLLTASPPHDDVIKFPRSVRTLL